MIKDFKSFINEAELNENPAVIAAAAPVVADMAAKKLAEGKVLEPGEAVDLIKESAGIYDADDNDDHTADGYVKEIVDSLTEAAPTAGEAAKKTLMTSLAAKSPKTASFAAQTA